MNYKKWLYLGIIILISSFLAGILGTVWGIYSSFDALKTIETTGISSVSVGIENALFWTVFSVIGCVIGLIIIIIGGIKTYRQSKS